MAYPVSGQQPWGDDLKAYIDDADDALAAADAALAAADTALADDIAALVTVDTGLDDRITALEDDVTSGEGLDADVAALIEDVTLTAEALGDRYASRETQDTVELGRLNNSVLTGRFGIPHIWIGAEQMWAGQGSPTAAAISSFTPSWRFNASVDQGVIFSRRLPQEWLTFDVYVLGANGGAGTGDVRVIGQWKNSDRDGDLLTGGLSVGAGVITVGVEHEQHRIKARTGLTNDPTSRHHFRIYRTPGDAADTLANDWEMVGVLLVATTFATIEPEIPEEPPSLEGRTFTEAHNALLDIQVHHQTRPPVDDTDDEEFKYFPGTDYSSRQVEISESTWTGGGKWGTIWDNRWNYGDAHSKKPNLTVQPAVLIGTQQCRTVFTTQALAQAATRAQIRHYLGMSTGDIQAVWTAAGGDIGDIITDTAFRSSPETYCTTEFSDGGETFWVATDVVVLPAYQFDASFHGVFLDYEPHDTRTPAETTAHISAIAADCHGEGYELFLYTNPLNGDAMPYNGIDATNLPTLLDVVDYITVLLWSDNDEGSIAASWAAQIALLGTITTPEWAKIAITFEMGPDVGGTTMDDAEWVYNKMHEVGDDHPTTVVIWRKGAVHGGSPSREFNKRLSMLCYGTETPPTP